MLDEIKKIHHVHQTSSNRHFSCKSLETTFFVFFLKHQFDFIALAQLGWARLGVAWLETHKKKPEAYE